MRIAFLLPLNRSDVERFRTGDSRFIRKDGDSFLLPLVYEIIQRGNSIDILTISDIESFSVEIGKLCVINIHGYKHGNISALLSFQREKKKLISALRQKDYDIIHAHWCYEYASAALAVNPQRTIITLHDWPGAIAEFTHTFYWRKRLAFGKENIRDCMHFIAVSPYIKSMIDSENPGKDVQIIPNFLPDECFDEKQIKQKKNCHNFIAISNSTERKNIGCTLKAFQLVRKKYPDSELTLYGPGLSRESAISTQAEKDKMALNVTFGGTISHTEILRRLEQADFLVHTSYEESFGMIIIEAISKGVVVVAGKDSGGPPWILDYGRAGIIADVTSPVDVANKIINCITSYEQERIRETAFKSAKERFCLSVVSDWTIKYYNHILGA